MRRLLIANGKRLIRNVWFWLGLAGMGIYAGFGLYSEYDWLCKYGMGMGSGSADALLFSILEPLEFIRAAFICMFIGEEYSNKTIRNKIIVGHSKTFVYLSNFMVCSMASILMYLLPFVIFTVIGIPVLGPFQYPQKDLLCFFCGIFGTVAKTAMYVAFSMLISNKTVSVIVALLMSYMLLWLSYELPYNLRQPQMIEIDVFDEETGRVIGTEMQENPEYMKNEIQRNLYEFFIVFFPQGQDTMYDTFIRDLDLFEVSEETIRLFPIYSIIFSSIATGCGVFIFGKKDLK